jgi:hypothetical protein
VRPSMRSRDNWDHQLKRNAIGAAAAPITRPIATCGEIFADGSIIELIRGDEDEGPLLMIWDGGSEIVGPVLEHGGRSYEPALTDGSVLRELSLPARCNAHGTTRELLAKICALVVSLVGLDEKSASLIGRVVLCSHLLEAMSVAPTILIVGPDVARGNRLMELLHCLCWHALRLTGVTPAGFCSLANGARYTYLISQADVSDKLCKLLDDSSRRERKIPFRGRLLDLFGVQVVHCDSHVAGDSRTLRSIQIPMISTGHDLPVFDFDTRHRITDEFQAKLLSFRRANLDASRKMQFDASKFTPTLRDRARSLAAGTPDDRELQTELFDLLREEDAEIRADKLIDANAIAGEAVLVAWDGAQGGTVYVSELAQIVEEILRRRGEQSTIEPAVFGKLLKLLGFTTERDARGKKLVLTEAVRDRAQELVRDFGGSEVSADPSQVEKGS